MTTPHPYADHPDVGKMSLAGTIITPDDVAAVEEAEMADALRYQQWEDDTYGTAEDNYDGTP